MTFPYSNCQEGPTFSYDLKTRKIEIDITHFLFSDDPVEIDGERMTGTEHEIRDLEKFVRAAIIHREGRTDRSLGEIFDRLLNTSHQAVAVEDIGDLEDIL